MGRKAIGVDPSSALSRREREDAVSWPTNLRCLKPGGRESPHGQRTDHNVRRPAGGILTREVKVPERGVEHRQPPCQPLPPLPVKARLTGSWTALAAPCHPILSNPVLTGPLANRLQRGGPTKIN